MYEKLITDVCIIGGGSSGFGAALQVLRRSVGEINVILVENHGVLGGTSTIGGVNCWEPGIGGQGVHKELYERLTRKPGQIGIGKSIKFYSPEQPWSISEIDPYLNYDTTLRRSGLSKEQWRRVHFEPDSMALIMENMLAEFRSIRIMYHTSFIDVNLTKDNIESIIVFCRDNNQFYKIKSKIFIDCTGDIIVARAAGCQADFGEDSKSKYGEPSAPEISTDTVNGVSLIFRVTPSTATYKDKIPVWAMNTDASEWINKETKPAVSINVYPNGDLNMNVLPIMEGTEYFTMSPFERNKICKTRAYCYWNWLQKEKGFHGYTFKHFFPQIGIRESYRLIGRYILTEMDVWDGFLKQKKREEVIAFADHALDIHGNSNIKNKYIRELKKPYGIPYSCLLPRELENLAVACRGASFSHIAASSCRLSRTMLAIGEAAGSAVVLVFKQKRNFHEINISCLRDMLKIPEFEEEMIQKWEES